MRDIKLGIEPTIGEEVIIYDSELGIYTQVQAHSVICESELGDYTYCAGYNQIDYAKIGKFCSIASFVRINPGNHPTFTRAAQHHFTYRREMFGFGEEDVDFFNWRKNHMVTIGHDVWIGHNACIMPGVTVGSGAVIGTAAVVTHDVEPYSIVVGIPAKKIKMRYPEELAEKLERTGWWNWSHQTLKSRIDEFNDPYAFAEKYSDGGQE
jgi:phosphonate metabolim protein, transferase hexapeptide repeat family